VLLEPIFAVELTAPSEALSRVTAIVSSRRGQILGYDGRPGWDGWDVLNALIPEAEMGGLIVELRSATAGVGFYAGKFDHLAEIVGKPAEAIIAHHNGAKAMAH
jgi:elongation factor G